MVTDCPQWRCPHVSVHGRREGATCARCAPCDCEVDAQQLRIAVGGRRAGKRAQLEHAREVLAALGYAIEVV